MKIYKIFIKLSFYILLFLAFQAFILNSVVGFASLFPDKKRKGSLDIPSSLLKLPVIQVASDRFRHVCR